MGSCIIKVAPNKLLNHYNLTRLQTKLHNVHNVPYTPSTKVEPNVTLPPKKAPVGIRTKPVTGKTKNSVELVTLALKAQVEQAKRAKELRDLDRDVRKGNDYVPAKRKGHTKASTTYGSGTFKQCPGGARDEARTGAYTAYLRQVDAVETGCIVVEPKSQLHQRLQNSAYNSNTTQGNYGYSQLH